MEDFNKPILRRKPDRIIINAGKKRAGGINFNLTLQVEDDAPK